MAFDTQNWLNSNCPADSILTFSGSINADVITSLVEESEQKIQHAFPEEGKMLKTAVHVLVELLQNIFHHGTTDESGNQRQSLLCIHKEATGIKIITGNYIPSEKIQIVRDRIEQINALSKDELKTLHKLILSNQEFTEKGGGGLGLIDIARKTGTKLEYNFVPLNEKLYFYILKISVV